MQPSCLVASETLLRRAVTLHLAVRKPKQYWALNQARNTGFRSSRIAAWPFGILVPTVLRFRNVLLLRGCPAKHGAPPTTISKRSSSLESPGCFQWLGQLVNCLLSDQDRFLRHKGIHHSALHKSNASVSLSVPSSCNNFAKL